jgi:ankyrin repeat protein
MDSITLAPLPKSQEIHFNGPKSRNAFARLSQKINFKKTKQHQEASPNSSPLLTRKSSIMKFRKSPSKANLKSQTEQQIESQISSSCLNIPSSNTFNSFPPVSPTSDTFSPSLTPNEHNTSPYSTIRMKYGLKAANGNMKKGSLSSSTKKRKSINDLFDLTGIDSSDLVRLLHYEAEVGHDNEAVYALLQTDRSIVNRVDHSGRSALHLAIVSGSLDITLLLLMQGADVNQCDQFEWTPLHFASYEYNEKILKHLLEYPSINICATNKDGNTPLHYAVRRQITPEILDLFIQKGANLNAKNENGDTPLHLSCGFGCLSTTKLLVQHGANVHLANNLGET